MIWYVWLEYCILFYCRYICSYPIKAIHYFKTVFLWLAMIVLKLNLRISFSLMGTFELLSFSEHCHTHSATLRSSTKSYCAMVAPRNPPLCGLCDGFWQDHTCLCVHRCLWRTFEGGNASCECVNSNFPGHFVLSYLLWNRSADSYGLFRWSAFSIKTFIIRGVCIKAP